MLRIIGFIATAFLIPGLASAEFIFSQTPYGNSTRTSDFQATSGINQQAETFSLAAPGSVVGLVFWGAYSSDATPSDDFTVRFFQDDGGDPQTTPFAQFSGLSPVQRSYTGDDTGVSNERIYEYLLNLPSAVSLAGSTAYYLSIVNNTSSTTAWQFATLSGTVGNDRWSRGSDASTWNKVNTDLAFRLSDRPVPEPASLALLAAGGVGLGFSRRRRRTA